MTGTDKFNKYYLVTAAKYEKRQIKPPPFTHKGIQNARIARAYGRVRDAQNNVPGKSIYQALTEFDREVEQHDPNVLTGIAPADITTSDANELWIRRYERTIPKPVLTSLMPGDHVRLVRSRSMFARGYDEKWSREVFVVKKVLDAK